MQTAARQAFSPHLPLSGQSWPGRLLLEQPLPRRWLLRQRAGVGVGAVTQRALVSLG